MGKHYKQRTTPVISITGKMNWLYIIIAVIMFWFSSASMAARSERSIAETEVKEEPVVYSIDRREAGLIGETGVVVRSDGTYNHVALGNEAKIISKVIYGVARNNPDKQKETVVWCILNRVENKAYPNTVEEVCKQSQQFEGFSIFNEVEEETFNLVYRILCDYYKNGYRISDSKFVYLFASGINIYLRDTFEINDDTEYWRADA